jgi:cytochrome c oxidase subunit 1
MSRVISSGPSFVSILRIRSESPAFDLHHPEVAALEMEHNEQLGAESSFADAPNVEGRSEHLGQTKGEDA